MPHHSVVATNGYHSNTAWTNFADVIVTTQVEDEPLQSPVQPTNRRFSAALAFSLIVLPVLNDLLISEQRVLQYRLPDTEPKLGFVLVSDSG